MFALRLVAVTLATFILLYCASSLTISLATRIGIRFLRSLPASRAADFLFCLRLFPLAASVALTALYLLPSFLILEPADIEEPLGPALVALAIAALMWLFLSFSRAVAVQRKTSQVVSTWTGGATRIDPGSTIPTLRVPLFDPILTVAGIWEPRVLISEPAAAILTPAELEVALRHEMAHIRTHDNVKKLLLCFSAFPGSGWLDSAWSDVSEMAADDAAVSSPSEALDLASALIKLSRFAPVQPSCTLTSALLWRTGTPLMTRVSRLFNWTEPVPKGNTSRLYALSAILAIAPFAVQTYAPLLVRMHAVTEWLVR